MILPGVPTRWKPRKVECTEDRSHTDFPGDLYAVKFVHTDNNNEQAKSAGMCISELVSAGVMQTVGFQGLEPVLVLASQEFAQSCVQDGTFDYGISVGYHFGTRFRHDLAPGPPETVDQLADPAEVLRLWVIDCWLLNCDRRLSGNVMMSPDGKGQWHLVASDHSDCFLGADCFSTERYLVDGPRFGIVSYLSLAEEVVLDHDGVQAVTDSFDPISKCAQGIRSITECVPDEWWERSGIDPERLEGFLQQRAEQIPTICDPRRWEGMQDEVRNGHQLKLDDMQ